MPRPAAQGKTSTVADARSANLVDRFAPAAILPYLRLARADRPIGFLLLALPCFWSVALASRSLGADYPGPLAARAVRHRRHRHARRRLHL